MKCKYIETPILLPHFEGFFLQKILFFSYNAKFSASYVLRFSSLAP